MSAPDGSGFHFGVEAEYLLVEAQTYQPLWHPDLTFAELNEALEAIAIDDLPPLDGLDLEPLHRRCMPYVVEGYHVPDADFQAIDLLPKGIEIRTPVCASIGECLRALRVLFERLQAALQPLGYRAVALSHHPTEYRFEGPQNKRRYDFWQWAMEVMVTYGPDINISLPHKLSAGLNMADLHAKVNYYAPALTALSLASPLYRGGLWWIRGEVGKSIRTYRRSVVAPAIELHPQEAWRLEFKTFEMSWRLQDFHNYFLLWLVLLLDSGLLGRASNQSRIYDLGAVARHGLAAEAVADRALEVLDRAPSVLEAWGFDPQPLGSFRRRLEHRWLPADEIIGWYLQEPSVPAILRRLDRLAQDEEAKPAATR